jgi:hypothetical protein
VARAIIRGIIGSQCSATKDNATKVSPFELIYGLEVVCRVFEKQVAKPIDILCSSKQTG